jgi:5'-3' exonuclease
MGIKDLSKFLKTEFPDLFETIHISEYQFQKVAIDTSLYMFHYKIVYQEAWLGAFIKLVAMLRENDVHCVFIFDTNVPHPDKEDERKERRENRDKTEERVYKLEQAVEKYKETGDIDNILLEFQEKRNIPKPRLIRPDNNSINIQGIEYQVEKMRKQLINITKEDFDTVKKLFKILDIPFFDAKIEADTLCADLCKTGKVDAVLSEDSDLMAYGCPNFLSKIDPKNGTCVRINYQKILEATGLSDESFLDFCIMCKTDYNKRIPMIGPVKSYKLIQTHGDIETIQKKTKLDITNLKHNRTRELFRDYESTEVKVPYVGIPDFSALQQFVFKKNIRIDVSYLENAFVRNNKIVIEEESNEEVDEEVNE